MKTEVVFSSNMMLCCLARSRPAQNVSFAVLSVDRRPAIRLILLALLALETY
jgi:hypothetical protein